MAVQPFIREGDWQLICYDKAMFTPWEDAELAGAVPGFLNDLS